MGTIQLPFAEIIDAGTIALMIPVMALMIPIIALLQHHQQKMAEIIHGNRHRELIQGELEEMRSEINQLRSTVSTQALALEGLANRKQISTPNETESLAQRLG
jgi:Mg2+ and Co2+ transporter CorA